MQHRFTAGAAFAAGLTAAALALTGCSTTETPAGDVPVLDTTPTVLPDVECVDTSSYDGLTEVSLMLQWLPQAQFGGYYAAECLGYFAEAGLDVEIIPTGGDIVPQQALFEGQATYAVAWVPKVLGSIEASGIEVTNIAQIFQKSGTMQIAWADSGIESVADFEGKRIGSWGFGNEWEIFAAMAAEGLDSTTVSITTQDFSMNALLDGDIDAAEAMTYNEYAQLLETEDPNEPGTLITDEDINIISYEDTTGAMLQDAIWARTADLKDPAFQQTTVDFLTAVFKGWIYVRDHTEEGASMAYAAALAAGDGGAFPVGPGHQLWMMNESNKLVWPSPNGIGIIDADDWAQTVEGALASTNEQGQKLITTEPPASAYTNEFAQKALDALADDFDVTGESYTPITVTLKLGGV